MLQLLLLILRFLNTANCAELKIVVNAVVIAGFLKHHVGDIGVALEVVVHLVGVVITEASWLFSARLKCMSLEPELVLKTHLAQGNKYCADTLTESRLELIRRHV